MFRADKFYGPDRQVLANISLSFIYGAKIGVLGPNGAGKSTLLRIMAGKEETSSGQASLAPGATVGLLEQEPELDPAMDALRLPDGDRDVVTLSGGERRRVALCRLLLSAPDLLLLDEPTNHLDAESVAWLERFLAEYRGTVVAVTHDRYFLDNVAGWILELDRGEIHIPWGPRLGDVVITAEGVQKGYGDRLLVEDLTFSLPPAGIVGVIGPNGAGKTTLFRMIAGEEQPDAGELRVGDTVQLAVVDQARADLDPASTVWKEISGGADTIELGRREVNSRQYVSWFNFKGPDQQKRVSDLSGGERNRVHLAKLLRSGGNVLLLDEPTNDL